MELVSAKYLTDAIVDARHLKTQVFNCSQSTLKVEHPTLPEALTWTSETTELAHKAIDHSGGERGSCYAWSLQLPVFYRGLS